MKVCSIVAILVAFWGLHPSPATAQQAPRPADSGFSFDVYGDSRSMMCRPYGQDQGAPMRCPNVMTAAELFQNA
jgi:hypothetical protein